MAYSRKVILNCKSGSEDQLRQFVEKCLGDKVRLVAVMGARCQEIEEIIDELVVGDGSDESRFLLTSAHPRESLVDVIKFAKSFTADYGDQIEIVEM
jgi:hypothetical protein